MGLDIVVALVVAFGFYAGYSRGLVKTVFDTMSLLIAILATMKLSQFTKDLLESIFNIPEGFTYLISLVVTFIVVMAAVRFIGRRVEDVFEAANINIINKFAGGALQGIFFAFILSMLIWTLGNYNVMKPETKQGSITYPYLEPTRSG
jgi:membrane protein required for colicin V production